MREIVISHSRSIEHWFRACGEERNRNNNLKSSLSKAFIIHGISNSDACKAPGKEAITIILNQQDPF